MCSVWPLEIMVTRVLHQAVWPVMHVGMKRIALMLKGLEV